MQSLIKLSEFYFGKSVPEPEALKGDGSDRQIFRFQKSDSSWIGITNHNRKENEAFLYLSKYFAGCDIPVPKVYASNIEEGVYLLEDLGDNTLADLLDEWNGLTPVNQTEIIDAYKKVLNWLPKIQFDAHKGLDYSFCFQDVELDEQAYKRYIKYFIDYFWNIFAKKYTFTSAIGSELDRLAQKIGNVEKNVMVHLDFQSRNIMWKDNNPYFIDYQSACRGALYYDIASLMYASKSGLSDKMRLTLINYYFEILQKREKIPLELFWDNFYYFVLIRRIRSLGTYGFLSTQKGKYHFLKAIPGTIEEIYNLLFNIPSLKQWVELRNLFEDWRCEKDLITSNVIKLTLKY